jgi:nucleoside-diphosphate-sugar epimerase
MTLKVAILGANGFIGNRIVEMLHLADLADVRPVVRRVASLASLSRFDVDCRVADAFDRAALCTAFAGCEVVVHAVAGDRKVILGTLAPTYDAAQAAGVRRLVYLSTATVHGQAPAPGTNENSPLHGRQPIPYNNAKVQAERRLRRLRRQGTVEVVILRPGIVVGPRSSWIASFASALLTGQAYLVHRGQGICNSIYIDNLVHAIYLALTATAADGEAFLLGDQEHVTWSDLYQPIAAALGVDITQVPEAPIPAFTPNWRERAQAIRSSPPVQALLSLFPRPLRQMASTALRRWYQSSAESPWALPTPPEPVVTREMALLYQCQYKLPFAKATKILGYTPIVSFPEACRRTVAWLAFAGYRLAHSGWGGEKR